MSINKINGARITYIASSHLWCDIKSDRFRARNNCNPLKREYEKITVRNTLIICQKAMAYYREYDKVYTKEAEGIHYLNFWMVIISWIFTITMILLPRFAWFNPDVRFELIFDKIFLKRSRLELKNYISIFLDHNL